jgi:N-dimethylarginine dimethylaminohydrolase
MAVLDDVYGDLLVVRAPVPATCNKAGANYKSEVTHRDYSPRRAYDEWLSILDGIVACGGDAIYAFDEVDDVYLDHDALEVDAFGELRPAGSSEVLGNLRDVETGRVFTANGPWVTLEGGRLRAVMQHMLPHRRGETRYYRDLLGRIADASGTSLEIVDNPHRWEGMADVAVVGDKVVLTYAVRGHYDRATQPKSMRSSREGVTFAADTVGVPAEDRIYAELVYPHFHGDTVHFGARPTAGPPVLVHYPGGLWGDGPDRVLGALGLEGIVPIELDDAVHQYAGNSRQVRGGVLVPDGVSPRFLASVERLGLTVHTVGLYELFGKAGGGPACATLYLPRTLTVPADAPFRYSATRDAVRARRDRIPERLTVDPDFFEGKPRG